MRSFPKLFATAVLSGALPVAFLTLAAGTANADSVNWDAIAQCESGGNWATNTGNGFYGGLQFKPTTWASNGGIGNPAHASREDQIRVAENVLAKQGIGAWPSCGSHGGTPFAGPGLPTGINLPTFGVPSTGGTWYPGKYLLTTIQLIVNAIPRGGAGG